MNDTKRLLQEALSEIERLRRRDEIQSAQLHVFNTMANLSEMQPKQYGGAFPDVTYGLRNAIDTLEKEGMQVSERGNVLVDQSPKEDAEKSGSGD